MSGIRFVNQNKKAESRNCLVCGKSMASAEGCFRTTFNKLIVLLCCPLCFEAFEKKPSRYLPEHSRITKIGKPVPVARKPKTASPTRPRFWRTYLE
jgi:hypothetical protein